MPQIESLQCSRCHRHTTAETPQTVCPHCAGAFYVRYNMEELRESARRPGSLAAGDRARQLDSRERQLQDSMWRYRDVLPSVEPVTLGEGWTPMLESRRYRTGHGGGVWLKEEATNPTGTFKARGMSMAVTMAKHYGLTKLAVPSAGNAAGALAAYAAATGGAAAGGLDAHIFMPRDVPFANYLECVAYGAHTTLVDGLISDCARIVNERKEAEGWFDISTLKEPFRVEGKKTMGYELVEQLGWEYPDAVFYPTGGGVGLIGMWKAFEEMEQLGWVSGKRPLKRPKMIAVQSSGCAPVARAFEEGQQASRFWEGAATFASGLRVPKPYGDSIILEVARESGGLVLDFPDEEILRSLLDWAKHEGLLLSPEGAAATAAYDHLLATGFLKKEDRVVLFNTGAGLKYTDLTAEAMGLERPGAPAKLPARMPVGGIITPQ